MNLTSSPSRHPSQSSAHLMETQGPKRPRFDLTVTLACTTPLSQCPCLPTLPSVRWHALTLLPPRLSLARFPLPLGDAQPPAPPGVPHTGRLAIGNIRMARLAPTALLQRTHLLPLPGSGLLHLQESVPHCILLVHPQHRKEPLGSTINLGRELFQQEAAPRRPPQAAISHTLDIRHGLREISSSQHHPCPKAVSTMKLLAMRCLAELMIHRSPSARWHFLHESAARSPTDITQRPKEHS